MSPGKNPRKLNIKSSALRTSTESFLIASSPMKLPTKSVSKQKVTFSQGNDAAPDSPTKKKIAKTVRCKMVKRTSATGATKSTTATNSTKAPTRSSKKQATTGAADKNDPATAKQRTAKVRLTAQHRAIIAAAVRIQAWTRGFLQRVRMERQAAALRIQAVARGWWSRLHTAIDLLQLRLKQIEFGRQRDLEAIERRKLHFFEVTRAELEREAFEALGNGAAVGKNQKLIQKLRLSNKKIRAQNVKLMDAMNKMDQSNFELQKEILQREEDTKELRKTINKMEREAVAWLEIAKKFKARHDEFVSTLQEIDDAIVMEINVRRSYARAVISIGEHVQMECNDVAVKQAIASVM